MLHWPLAHGQQPRVVAPESRGAASFFVLPVGEPYIDVPQGTGAYDPQLVTLGGLWARYGNREWYVRLDPGACDVAGLLSGIAREESKRDAFAAVLGWPRDEVGTRLAALRGGYLQSHLDVINHGYANGVAFGSPRRLAAGTAVLIDRNGIPVVRCACGNPLLSLAPQDEPPLPAQLADGGELSEEPKLGEVDETPLVTPASDKGSGDSDEQPEVESIDPAEVLDDLLSEEDPSPVDVAREDSSTDGPFDGLQAPAVPNGGMFGGYSADELPLPLGVVIVALLPIADDLGDDMAGDGSDDEDFMDGVGGGGDMPPDEELGLPPGQGAVPIPATGWLFAGALAWLAWSRTRRRHVAVQLS